MGAMTTTMLTVVVVAVLRQTVHSVQDRLTSNCLFCQHIEAHLQVDDTGVEHSTTDILTAVCI